MKEIDAKDTVKLNGNINTLVLDIDNSLFVDIKELIEDNRFKVAQTVNTGVTVMYWNIGQKINDDIFKNKRVEYGKQVIATVSKQLVEEFGEKYSEKNLRRMMQFNEVFPDFNNLVSLIRQLSWTHFIVLIPINVAEYISEILSKELLQKKLHKFHFESKNLIENMG